MDELKFDLFKGEVEEQMAELAHYLGQIFQVLEMQKQAYESMSSHILELKHRIEDLELGSGLRTERSGTTHAESLPTTTDEPKEG